MKANIRMKILTFISMIITCLSLTVSAATVDLLVVYDSYSKNYFANEPEVAMQGWVAQINNMYQDSQIDVQLRLVGVLPRESAGNSMLEVLQNMSPDENLNRLRDQLGADIVTQLHQTGACGIAWVAVDKNWAWNVTGPDCGSVVLAHELGHNMGLWHSRIQGDTRGVRYDYALGHGVQNVFGTIMTYHWLYNAPRVARFSNPDVDCFGFPCGVPEGHPDQANAALAINNVKDELAAFRGNPDPECTTESVGSTIQAENYCGMSGVQTENTTDTDGGQNVGWIDFGDSMSYNINAPLAGKYTVSYRVAANTETGHFQLDSGAQSVGTVQFAATGGWQNWQTVSHEVTLPAGTQKLTIKALSAGWNLNWFRVDPVVTTDTTPIVTLQAENFSFMSGVQIENTTDVGGGQNVSHIDAGDWLSYVNSPVDIPSTGTYEIEFRVASLAAGGNLNFEEAGGSPLHTTFNFNATGGWQNWVSVKKRITLTAGTHRFGVKANSSEFNINWFKINKVN